MIDTLMVLWTSGSWKHLLRSAGTFLLLFVCICTLLFLVTTSNGKWSGLAITQSSASAQADGTAQPASPATHATAQPALAPTAAPTTTPYIMPVILQNPIVPEVPTHARSEHKQYSHRHTPTHTPSATPTTVPTTPPENTFPEPTNPLQNLP